MSLGAATQETCPRCGELAPASAESCGRCGVSLLVDVVLEAPIADARQRYETARAAVALGAWSPPFGEVRDRLALRGAAVMEAVPREFAREVLALIEKSGGHGRARPRKAVSARAPLLPARTWAMLGVFAFVLGGARIYVMHEENRLRAESAARASAAMQAAQVTGLATPKIAEDAIPSTATVRCRESLGSGFLIAPEKLLTNAHVLCRGGEAPTVAFSDGVELKGELIEKNEHLDLALLRVKGATGKPLPLGDATTARTGTRVIAIGSPKGLDFSVHEGTISHGLRDLLGVGYLQAQVDVNPGNSGGPLLDDQGRVVGVVSMMLRDSNGLGFALPINYLWSAAGMAEQPASAAAGNERWVELMSQVARDDEKERAADAERFTQPGLFYAVARPDGAVVTLVMKRSEIFPRKLLVHFAIRRDGHDICKLLGESDGWDQVADFRHSHPIETLPASEEEGRLIRWATERGLASSLYFAVITARPEEGCKQMARPGATLVIPDGEPTASSVEIREPHRR